MSAKAARRYAKAVLETAIEQNIVEDIKKDMELILGTLKSSRDLILFLKSPIIKTDKKRNALQQIFEKRVTKTTFVLINLLLDKDRGDILQSVCESFIDMYNIHKGIVNVGVFSAFDVADQQQKTLQKALEKSTGKKIQLNIKLDQSLRGGMAVKIDDTIIDGTVKHKLSQLKNQFAANAAK